MACLPQILKIYIGSENLSDGNIYTDPDTVKHDADDADNEEVCCLCNSMLHMYA